MRRRVGKGYRAAVLFVLILLLASAVMVPAYPADAAATTPGTIRGRVTDAEGRGLAGVEVAVGSLEQENPVASSTTAADGSFTITGLAPGSYDVAAALPDGSLGQARLNVEVGDSHPEVRVDFVLDPSVKRGGVTGRLDGDAGSESQILFYPQDPGEGAWSFWWVTPDETGSFSIGLPAGSYLLEAISLTGHQRALIHQRRVRVKPGEAVTANIPLKSTNPAYAEIRGRLATTDPGVRVQAVTVLPVSDSSDNVLWQVAFPGGAASSYRVANLPPGEYYVTANLVWMKDEAWPAYHYARRVRLADKESLVLDFDRLAPPATVRGRVVDESGKPVAGVTVAAFSETIGYEDGPAVPTDDDGRFTLYLAEGKYELWLGDEEQPDRQFHDAITVQSGKTIDLGDLVFQEDGGAPGDRLTLKEEDVKRLLEEEREGDILVIQVPGTEVSLPASAAGLLRDAGKSTVTLDFGGAALVLPLADLDVDLLAEADPRLAPWKDEPGLELRYGLRPARPAVPKGLVAAGDGLAFTVSAYVPKYGERSLSALVHPARLVLPVEVEREADKALVGLWRAGAGTPLAVPSWTAADGTLVAAVSRPGTYLPALRRAAFHDTRGHWAEGEVAIAFSHGIVNGKDAAGTRFAPAETATRAEFVAMLVRATGLEPDSAAAARFKDVARDAWFAGYVGAAVQAGLVTGTTSTTFTPGARITRLHLAAMIGRALKAQGFRLEGSADEVLARFRDARSVGAWAREDLALAVQAGIVRGVDATTLAPHQHATRAQVAAMLVRYLEYVLGTGE